MQCDSQRIDVLIESSIQEGIVTVNFISGWLPIGLLGPAGWARCPVGCLLLRQDIIFRRDGTLSVIVNDCNRIVDMTYLMEVSCLDFLNASVRRLNAQLAADVAAARKSVTDMFIEALRILDIEAHSTAPRMNEET